jgi:hypothetical protein
MIYLVDIPTDLLLAYHQRFPADKPNVLISYARLSKDSSRAIFDHRNLIGSLILDSGTYSLYNNREKYSRKLTLAGYKGFLKHLGKHFDFCFNFDEDYSRNGFHVNFVNQNDLEKAGFEPVPVVHDCYGSEIQFYIDQGYRMIAIGSSELKNENYQELYRIVEKPYSQGVKVHFLGSTEFLKLAFVPVFSADSATWNHAGCRGHLIYWNPNISGPDKTEKIRFNYGLPKRLLKNHIDTHPQREEIEEYLGRELGLTIDQLKGSKGVFYRRLANIHFYVQMEKRIKARHRALGFKF